MTGPRNVAIVGAGECGARAAFALRSQGFDGTITLIGSERHLPYERPPLSKAVCGDGEFLKPVARKDEYVAAVIDLRLGVAVEDINRRQRLIRLADGGMVSYDKLLLATGARARKLPGVHYGGRVHSLRTFDDARAIREALRTGASLAVVGGGFIGLELAAAARSAGSAVTVIETQERLLKRAVPEEIAAVIAERHRQAGAEILCGIETISVTVEDGMPILDLGDDRVIRPDHVVIGIGAIPNTELALNSGIDVDNGIAVDVYLRTSDPDIYAAGDCCSFPLPSHGHARIRLEAWRNAQEQAELVAANIRGEQRPISSIPWFWSDQYDLSLQIAGIPANGKRHVRRDIQGGGLLLFHLSEDGTMVGASGIGRGNAVAKDIRLSEMLIAAGKPLEPAELSSAGVQLKSLLRR